MPQSHMSQGVSFDDLKPPPTPAFDIQAEQEADIAAGKERFLQAWSEFDHFGKACKFAQVQRYQVNRWKEADPEFRRRMDEIKEDAVDDVEENLKKKATDPGVADGAQVKAIELYLKANRPDKYNPQQKAGRSNTTFVLVIGAPPKAEQIASGEFDGARLTIDTKAEDARSAD